MKKRLMLVVSGILAVTLAITCLVGCTKKGQPVDYAGKYIMTQAVVEGEVFEGEEFRLNYPANENYIEIIDSENIIFVLRGTKLETTYTKEGDVLHVEDTTGTVNFIFEDGKLIYSENDGDYKLVFTKN